MRDEGSFIRDIVEESSVKGTNFYQLMNQGQ